MDNTEKNLPVRPSKPTLSLEEGELKQVALVFTQENGVVKIGVLSEGFDEDINKIAVALSFALEKMTN